MNNIHSRSDREAITAEFEKRFVQRPSGCWEWAGSSFTARGGYGCATMRPFGIVNMRAHRLAWKLYRGDISSAQHVLHRCDNPKCVNPEHLFLGDQILNMADRDGKHRQNRGDTHGRHKLTESQAVAIIADERWISEIAKAFSVSESTVSNIKCGRSWKHLGPRVGRRVFTVARPAHVASQNPEPGRD